MIQVEIMDVGDASKKICHCCKRGRPCCKGILAMAASVMTSDNAVMILEFDVAKAVSDARNDGRACSCYQPRSAMLAMLSSVGDDATILGQEC
jgi:hypothetical protein